MKRNLELMRDSIKEWLTIFDIVDVVRILEQKDWPGCGTWPTGAALVLEHPTDYGSFVLKIDSDLIDLKDRIRSFGFDLKFEHGDISPIFPIKDFKFNRKPDSDDYRDVLKDARWKEKANLVKSRAKHHCQDCGAEVGLHAHHCYYERKSKGLNPWEYPLSSLRALCPDCHKTRELVEMKFRIWAAKLTHAQISRLTSGVDSASSKLGVDKVLDALNNSSMDQLKKFYDSTN